MKKICFVFTFIFFIFTISEAKTFSDINNFAWAKDAINRWANRGIIAGYTDGTFKGNNNVKRSEMITIVNRLNNSSEASKAKPARDVNTNAWYSQEMSIALNNGLIELDNNYNLRPEDYATREETFVVLAKLFKVKYTGNSSELLATKFTDYKSLSSESYPYIAGLIKENYVSGYQNKTLKPKSRITRAELVAIIDKMVSEVYTEGTVSNKTIYGNVVVNGNGVELKNVNVSGSIFVMDGAKSVPPVFTSNTTATNGIVSRIGDIYALAKDRYNPLVETSQNGSAVKYALEYSKEGWTTDNVIVTLNLEDDDYEIVNNSGKNTYTFEDNGEFVFLVRSNSGVTSEIKAKVSKIDKIAPEVMIIKIINSGSASVNVTVEDDGLSSIRTMKYAKGRQNIATVTSYGEDIIDNKFDATESGIYTIVVEDRAGNITREMIEIELGDEADNVQD
ncbi:MAG: S-layer homology domain-containing protein [Clostridia bacterium]|nr:S-layer homology domain-containing protein [Clostridia bacterium]